MAVEWVAFHITDRCQLDCAHCLRDPAQRPTDLAPALIARVLDEARKLYRSRHAAFTGGEPTLHPELGTILDAVVERGMTWHLVTNAGRFDALLSLLNEKPARRAALTVLHVSLDGADEATHDGIRGAGSFRDVMGTIARCTALGINFAVQMTVHAGNADQIDAFGLMAAQLGASRVAFAFLQPTGTHRDAALFLTPGQWRAVQDRVERLAQTLRVPVTMPEGFRQAQPFYVCAPFRSDYLHIDVHGRLNLCCQHADTPSEDARDVAADLNTTSLTDAHGRLLGIIHEAQAARLATVARGEMTEWDWFPCNHCLKHFGKPHWDGDGAAGPAAKRERWRGAWAPSSSDPSLRGRRDLPIVD